MKLSSIFLICSRIIKPKDSALTNARKSLIGAVFCIALSLIPLTVVLIVTDGMIEGITNRIIGLSSFHLQVAQVRTYADTEQNLLVLEDVAENIKKHPKVLNTYIERQGTVLAAGKTGRSGATVRAIEPKLFTENKAFTEYLEVIEGNASFLSNKSCVIGKKIAELLGVSVGDTVRLISTRTSVTGSVIPKISTFKVEGIVSSGYQEIDALWVFIPLESGFEYLSTAASTICVGVETSDPFDDSFYRTMLDIETSMPSGFSLYTWKELNASQYENFASTKLMLLFVMFLIVLVASVNVSSALVMLVMEKRKDIAILKSLGASNKGIGSVFVLTGGVAGLLGTLIGIPLGLLCAVNINSIITFFEKIINTFTKLLYYIKDGSEYIPVSLLDPAYYLETIPIVIPGKEILIILFGTIILSVLVSIIPASKAAKEKPISIIRKI